MQEEYPVPENTNEEHEVVQEMSHGMLDKTTMMTDIDYTSVYHYVDLLL